MEDIGIVTNDSSNKEELINIISQKNYQISSINNKNELGNLDGIVLYFNHENWLTEAIDWILLLKKEPQLFIWVLIPEIESNEKAIFFQLGANYVFSFPTEQKLVSYTIYNTFACIENFRELSPTKPELSLIENDVSVVVGEKEKTLTQREYLVMSLLLEKKETTVTYEAFAQRLWPDKKFSDSYEMRSYIANIVYSARKKLKESQWIIQTTRQKGYRLAKS